MPCSVKDYIEREKRLIDISILARLPRTFNEVTLGTVSRVFGKRRETQGNRIYRTEITAQLDQPILVQRRTLIAHSFVRFSVLINSLIDAHIYVANLPLPPI